jgi:hypothetical protein
MRIITKHILIALFAFMLLSCNRTAQGNQNTAYQQGTDAAIETTVDVSENEPAVFDVPEITNLTLIPSVEPELLRNVMPNSWRRLDRLTEAEEQTFIAENINVLLEIEEAHLRDLRQSNGSSHKYFSIYRQRVGFDAFYRIISTTDSNPNFMSRAVYFDQYLVYQNSLLVSTVYMQMSATQFGWIVGFQSMDIILSRDSAKGIMITTLSVGVGFEPDPSDWSITSSRRNSRLFGGTESHYFLMGDLRNGIRSPIRISASHCLVDPDIPLRHSLQNAFDGYLSTSFVAIPAEELMSISIGHTISGIAIINSHTNDIVARRENSQIRKIETVIFINEERRDVELATDTMSWQIIEGAVGGFSVNAIFPENNSNNIFLTGLNAYSIAHGWLFGDIDE